MEALEKIIDIFLHLDTYLDGWGAALGPALYVVLFLVIFCETGLVVTPFLPGDSLLFAAGALAARPDFPLEIGWLVASLCVAGVLGNAVNYSIGYRLGPKVFSKEDSWLFNKKYLLKAQAFYERYGGKTIVLARFVPIIRTFAPFVAGIGRMSYRRYMLYNLLGTLPWVGGFAFAGYFFGNIPAVKRNFQFVVIAIIVISVIPAIVGYLKERKRPA
ncbi:MAG: DedA family protein [Proteobacteria bacterium]|jgi:membrane-associated protein|nr:DedA family protein [Pseudomonadota bacterium]